jgi:hypothetical protein
MSAQLCCGVAVRRASSVLDLQKFCRVCRWTEASFCSGLDLVHGPRSCACTNARRLARRWTAREQTSQNDALYTCGIIKRDICRVHGSPRAATSRAWPRCALVRRTSARRRGSRNRIGPTASGSTDAACAPRGRGPGWAGAWAARSPPV